MAMKTSELMIGDFVNVNGLNLKVGAIHADEIGVFDPDYKIYWCSDDGLDRIDPIPLTKDILVKNGFKYAYNESSEMQNKQLLVANIGSHYIEVRLDKKNVAIWYDYDENESGFYSDVFLPLPYFVHGFQHLLRIVGVQKEIEL